ncbi:histidine kinase [Streptomyces anthocyanicus]|uniref:ATP-binding protein n=1 Tax=Streptomyces anthocyanicus TaxID=68174 RepID=UPI00166F6BAB|nr:ATP-binding protein [Streptomyces anthocyanicus]GGL36292.1 histidine kinase [Streptomyces anthocyanicus]
MPDSALTARPAATGHRRRRPPVDANTLHLARRAVALPLMLLAALLLAAFALRSGSVVGLGWVLAGLVCGLAGVVAVAAHGARTVVDVVQSAVEDSQATALNAVAGGAAAVEKSVQWSADELCRGRRPALPDLHAAQSPTPTAGIDNALSALQTQAIASLIRVHDESQSVVLLEVLRRLAMREHALVSKALQALSQLEMLTDDPELLAKIFKIDHLVTRMRRQVESTAVLGGQSLRSVRRPVPVTTALRGAVSEVVQYPRVAVAAGSVGAKLGLPGHVGPDLTHLLAELIENACECSDPATRVMVRAQRVPHGLAIEVEDRAIPMPPQTRAQMNHLLKAPDEVDATALVVIPARLLVATPSVEDAGAPPPEGARISGRQPQQVAAAPATSRAGQDARPDAAGEPTTAGHSADAPALPTRTRRTEPFRPLQEREQAPLAAATPGLAAAFRNGLQAGGTAGPPPGSTEQHPTP